MELVVQPVAPALTNVEQRKVIATWMKTALAVYNVGLTTVILHQDFLQPMTAVMIQTLALMEVEEYPAAPAPTHVKQGTETATMMMSALALCNVVRAMIQTTTVTSHQVLVQPMTAATILNVKQTKAFTYQRYWIPFIPNLFQISNFLLFLQ